jgi:pimeloyl-ACP methyl ester carboxylesterase
MIQDYWRLMSDKRTVEHWISDGRIWQPETAPAGGVEQSTLIIHGELGTRVPAQVALELARLKPNSTLKLLPNSRCWPFASHTQIVESEIKKLLQPQLLKAASLA